MVSNRPYRVNGISLEHPDAAERRHGAKSAAELTVIRPSGSALRIPVDEATLVRLISDIALALDVLRRQRGRESSPAAPQTPETPEQRHHREMHDGSLTALPPNEHGERG